MGDFIIEYWSEIVIFAAILYNIAFVSYKITKWKTDIKSDFKAIHKRLEVIECFAKEQSDKFDELDNRLREMEKEVAVLAVRINNKAVKYG